MQRSSARTLYRRTMRLVLPFVALVSVVTGIGAMLAIRGNARVALINTQLLRLSDTIDPLRTGLEEVQSDATELAGRRSVRSFARDTLVTGSATLQQSQTTMIADFAELLENNVGSYITVRYVTFNGAVWSETTLNPNGIIEIDRVLRLGALAGDSLVTEAAGITPGSALLDGLQFRRAASMPFIERQRPILRAAAPVAAESTVFQVAGLIQVDTDASALLRDLREQANALADSASGRRVALVDDNGNILYDTSNREFNYVDALFSGTAPTAATSLPEGLGDYRIIRNGDSVGSLIVSSVALPLGGASTTSSGHNWTVILLDDEFSALSNSLAFAIFIFFLTQVIAFSLVAIIGLALRRTLQPVEGMRDMVLQMARQSEPDQELTSGGTLSRVIASAPSTNVTPIALPEGATSDISDLLGAFQSVTSRMSDLQQELDAQRGRFTRNIDVAARVSRETATLYDIDEMLNRAIRQICEEYGFYHAQVFLLDDIGENAVLVYSYGERGRRLLERGHKLAVGSQSVIGTVTSTGRPVVVNDTGISDNTMTHRPNPLLAETRAEMAVPLQFGDQIIGALDIQSTQPDAFQPEEVRVFQMIADQIAVAIQNVRLLGQSDQRFQQIDTLNRQLTRTAWEAAASLPGSGSSFSYDLLRVTPGVETSTDPDSISVPIVIRGEVVGTLQAAPGENAGFTEADRALVTAVADRVAIAIENARLFEETQSSLSETFTLYQLSRYLNEATSLDDVIQAIIVSVMPDAVAGQIAIFEAYPEDQTPSYIEVAADWKVDAQESRDVTLNGMELRVSDHPIIASMQPTEITLVSNAERDNRLDDVFRALIISLGASSVVFIPFSVRGVWRGVIMVEFPDVRTFSEREGRIYSALIDQAGVAIDARMLLRQNEMALAEIERLYTASRIINMAQSMTELVRAAVTTAIEPGLEFELGAFSGSLDATGWSTSVNIVARSTDGDVEEVNETFDMIVSPDSPLRRRDPVRIQNIDASEGALIEYLQSRGAKSATILPLFSANQPIALFFILGSEMHYLSEDEMEVYRALTGQMSTVLQNRRLLDQTARALDETRRLYATTRAITNADDQSGVYAAAANGIVAGSPAIARVSFLSAPGETAQAPSLDYVYVYLREDSSQTDYRAGMRVPRSALPLAEIVTSQEGAIVIPDTRDDVQGWEQLRTMSQRNNTRSLILTAIQTRLGFYGVMVIESDQPNVFDDGFANFAQAVTDQVATAVEGIGAFQEAQVQAQRALALAEAGQLAAAVGGEFAESIGEVFSRVAQPANYDRWLLTLVSEDQTHLDKITQRLPGVTQSGNERPETYNLSTDQTPITLAYLENRTFLVNEPSAFPSLSELPEPVLNLYGKHLVTPVRRGNDVIGTVMVGRPRTAPDLDDNDEQLVKTLAAQIAVAVENRRLFSVAETERERLSAILSTLPAGVAVLDPHTFRPIQHNEQAVALLGEALQRGDAFTVEAYNILRSGTNSPYPEENLPFRVSQRTGLPASSDDVSMINEDGRETDLLINSAPLLDANGEVIAIVTAFEDISGLRTLERTLEANLRETVALYETSRALAEADSIDDVLDQIIFQLGQQEPSQAFILLLDPDEYGVGVARSMDPEVTEWTYPDELLDPNKIQIIRDVADSYELEEPLRLTLLDQNIHAYAVLPMRARRELPLGWLVVLYERTEEFLPEREQFLLTLNDSAAVALDNRYLFRSTNQALQETGQLYDATAMISRARSLESISDALQRSLSSLKPDLYAGYIMIDGVLTELFNEAMDSDPVKFETLIKKHQLSNMPTLFLDDLRELNQPTPLEADMLTLGTVRAVAIVPLQAQDMNTGCLFVGYHFPRRFQSGEGRYLSAVADSASVVIDNYLLLERIQSTLEETSKLYQASRALSDASEPEDILQIVTDYLIGPETSQAFITQLLSSSWEVPNALARVAATWYAPDAEAVDLSGITLTAEQYPAWRLLATPDLMTIGDVETAPELNEDERLGLLSLDLKSIAILPLRASGRAIGSIVIGSSTMSPHQERDLRIYRSFAEQASLRLEATRSLRQAERRARQLVTSSEVSQIAGSLLDLDQLLPRIVDLIRERFEYDHVQIFLMDDENVWANLRASTGDAGRQMMAANHRLQKGSQSVIGQVTENATPTIAADTADARVVHRPNPYLPNTRSEMALPLLLKGHVVGALDVQSNNPNAFDNDDIVVLTTLGGQIATAIDNAQLYDQARRRANEMGFLFSVTTAAASADTLVDAVQNVADELANSLDAISAAIYLPEQYVDSDDQTFTLLRPIALAGGDQPLSELSEVRLDTAQSLIASAASNRRPLILADISTDPRYLPIVDSARSVIIVPLSSGPQFVGLISMESEKVGAFNEDTLTLLLTLAGTLSAIVQNQQLLEQVQTQNDALRELDRLKSDFLANMSHELRTPLNSIIGFSRVILKGIDGPLTEMQEQDLTTIYNSGMHLLNLINDILDQAKIAAGKMDLQFDYFEIKGVVDGVRSIGIGLVKDKPIDILVDMAPNMPKAYGDEFRTRQILLNLVSNASKFTREGTITVSAYPVRDNETGTMMVRVDVTDTGIGIAEKDIPLLFEAFRQVDSSLTRTAGGTGLGLPIAKSLVEMQGGRMLVSSAVNVGSIFSLLMPVEPVVPVEEPPKRKTDQLPDRPASKNVTGMLKPPPQMSKDLTDTNTDLQRIMTRKRQILLVEDNPDMVDQFRRALSREGFEIFAATIPLEAEAMASGLHPTIIIMDVNFSNGAGWDILKKLQGRDDTSDIPVVIVSLSNEIDKAMEMGAFRFVRRPFLPDDITQAVKEAEEESRIERILIIDDTPEHSRLIQQILSDHGRYKVFIANSGMEGIGMVARRRPNLIITDLRMPDMDGFQVVKELRDNPETATIPILIVTGETLTPDERQQLMNLAVLFKSRITSEEYRELLDGVNGYLDRN